MIEVNIDHSEITRLAELLERSPEVIAAAKVEAVAAAATKMKEIVDQAIGGSGRVKNWQGQYIGSAGLYAAVRPKAKTYAESRGNQTFEARRGKPHPTYAVGCITNAINSGHAKSVDSMGFHHGVVHGKRFYQQAAVQLGQVAEEAGERVSKAVAEHFSGARSTAASSPTVHAGEFPSFTVNIGGRTVTFKSAGS